MVTKNRLGVFKAKRPYAKHAVNDEKNHVDMSVKGYAVKTVQNILVMYLLLKPVDVVTRSNCLVTSLKTM